MEYSAEDRHVRLWGGGADLLWDDMHGDNEYFWICNSPDRSPSSTSESIRPSTDPFPPFPDNPNYPDPTVSPSIPAVSLEEEENTNSIQMDRRDGDTQNMEFWKFAIVALLVVSTCILVLRLRTTWKSCDIKAFEKQRTDQSILDSFSTHSRLPQSLKNLYVTEQQRIMPEESHFNTIDQVGFCEMNDTVNEIRCRVTMWSDTVIHIHALSLSMIHCDLCIDVSIS